MTNILTLRMDEASQAHFERMRQLHYPAALNQIAAHLTLFHTLPDTSSVRDGVAAAARSHEFSMRVTGLRPLGRGVAYTLVSDALLTLHAQLSLTFKDDLSAQDRQRFMPHVVIQNKSTPEQARALLSNLRSSFQPFEVAAVGLDLWHYLGGPWKLAESFAFTGPQAPGPPSAHRG